MDRYEFIRQLQRHLTGRISAVKLREITQYYEDYINTEIGKGKTEKEVLEALGDPRLLAKSIISTEKDTSDGGAYGAYHEDMYRGMYDEEYGRAGGGMPYKLRRALIWIVALLIVVAVLSIVFSIVGVALNILFQVVLPLAVPVLLVYWLVKYLFLRK